MKLQELTLRTIRLPLVHPYVLSYRTFTEFEPIIVEARDPDGRVGWGEGHIMDLKYHDTRELQPGMAFHVVPAMRRNGEYGVGVSETVAVTETGAEVLTSFSRELFERG